jgi:hypothetical protein
MQKLALDLFNSWGFLIFHLTHRLYSLYCTFSHLVNGQTVYLVRTLSIKLRKPLNRITSVNNLDRIRLEAAYARWIVMNLQGKQDTWTKELRRAFEMTLGSFIADIGTRDTWLAEEDERVLRSIEEGKEKTTNQSRLEGMC